MSDIKDIRSRQMFGGWGIYSGEKFFAIVQESSLYFKTNEKTSKKYIDAEMQPFAPSEEQILKNYYEVPADVIENKDEIVLWAEESIDS